MKLICLGTSQCDSSILSPVTDGKTLKGLYSFFKGEDWRVEQAKHYQPEEPEAFFEVRRLSCDGYCPLPEQSKISDSKERVVSSKTEPEVYNVASDEESDGYPTVPPSEDEDEKEVTQCDVCNVDMSGRAECWECGKNLCDRCGPQHHSCEERKSSTVENKSCAAGDKGAQVTREKKDADTDIIEDNWKDNKRAHRDMGYKWTGTVEFERKRDKKWISVKVTKEGRRAMMTPIHLAPADTWTGKRRTTAKRLKGDQPRRWVQQDVPDRDDRKPAPKAAGTPPGCGGKCARCVKCKVCRESNACRGECANCWGCRECRNSGRPAEVRVPARQYDQPRAHERPLAGGGGTPAPLRLPTKPVTPKVPSVPAKPPPVPKAAPRDPQRRLALGEPAQRSEEDRQRDAEIGKRVLAEKQARGEHVSGESRPRIQAVETPLTGGSSSSTDNVGGAAPSSTGATKGSSSDEHDVAMEEKPDDGKTRGPTIEEYSRRRSENPTEQDMRDESRSEHAALRSLILEIGRWAQLDDKRGETRYVNLDNYRRLQRRDWVEPERERMPEELTRRILAQIDTVDHDPVYIQIARNPIARRVAFPHCKDEEAPWRYSLLLLWGDAVRKEGWVKTHGVGKAIEPEEKYVRMAVEWGIYIFAMHKIAGTSVVPRNTSVGVPAEPDETPWATLPLNLGRLTKYLVSPHEKHRLQGLAMLHKSHWHASLPRMKSILERAGIDAVEAEIIKVIKACKSCAMWQLPLQNPSHRTSHPSAVNQQCEFDYFSNEGQNKPIGHILDLFIRYPLTDQREDKSFESTTAVVNKWVGFLGPMKQLISDQEGALASTEAGVWLQRKGIKRELTGKHRILVIDRHHALIRRTCRLLKADCEAEGLNFTDEEILAEATAAKNMVTEFGGYSPLQGLVGSHPDHSLLDLTGEDEPSQKIIRMTRLRVLAQKAICEAIYQLRLARSVKGRMPATDYTEIKPGMDVRIWQKPNKKSEPGWTGPATVLDNSDEGTITVKWQGRVLPLAPNHVTEYVPNLIFFTDDHVPLMENENFLALVRAAEEMRHAEVQVHGVLLNPDGDGYVNPEALRSEMKLMKAARKIGVDYLDIPLCHGVKLGRGVRRMSGVARSTYGKVLMWPRGRLSEMSMFSVRTNQVVDVLKFLNRDVWSDVCILLFYCYVDYAEPATEAALEREYQDVEEHWDHDFRTPPESTSPGDPATTATRSIRCPTRGRSSSASRRLPPGQIPQICPTRRATTVAPPHRIPPGTMPRLCPRRVRSEGRTTTRTASTTSPEYVTPASGTEYITPSLRTSSAVTPGTEYLTPQSPPEIRERAEGIVQRQRRAFEQAMPKSLSRVSENATSRRRSSSPQRTSRAGRYIGPTATTPTPPSSPERGRVIGTPRGTQTDRPVQAARASSSSQTPRRTVRVAAPRRLHQRERRTRFRPWCRSVILQKAELIPRRLNRWKNLRKVLNLVENLSLLPRQYLKKLRHRHRPLTGLTQATSNLLIFLRWMMKETNPLRRVLRLSATFCLQEGRRGTRASWLLKLMPRCPRRLPTLRWSTRRT